MSEILVSPVGCARVGTPEPCPTCGHFGLSPVFGQKVDARGRRVAVIDTTQARCSWCETVFRTTVA